MELPLASALTAHRAREKTIEMLNRDIPDFISSLQWPPNGFDLKPPHYAIWGKLKERVYPTRIHDRDVDHLVERYVKEWSRFDHTSPVLQLLMYQARLRWCVKADRPHCGHFFSRMLQFHCNVRPIVIICRLSVVCFSVVCLLR